MLCRWCLSSSIQKIGHLTCYHFAINCSHFLSSDNLLEIVQYARFVRAYTVQVLPQEKIHKCSKSIDPSMSPNCEITFLGNISIAPKHAQSSNDLKLLEWHQVSKVNEGLLAVLLPLQV